MRLRAVGRLDHPRIPPIAKGAKSARAAVIGRSGDATTYDRARLAAGNAFVGPAIVVEDYATTYLPGGWRAAVDRSGHLVLTR